MNRQHRELESEIFGHFVDSRHDCATDCVESTIGFDAVDFSNVFEANGIDRADGKQSQPCKAEVDVIMAKPGFGRGRRNVISPEEL